MSAEDNAAAGCGPVMSRTQVRQAAQVYYEATPGATLLEVARRFNVGESSVGHWSSEDKVDESHICPYAIPRRSVDIMKRATGYKGALQGPEPTSSSGN